MYYSALLCQEISRAAELVIFLAHELVLFDVSLVSLLHRQLIVKISPQISSKESQVRLQRCSSLVVIPLFERRPKSNSKFVSHFVQ